MQGCCVPGIGSTEVLVLAGRKHAYETGEADGMKGAIRTWPPLGVQVLVQTNAAGSMDASMRPGALMLISDHLNLVQRSPLFNEPGDKRFVDMSAAYCPALRAQALAAAQRAGTPLREGVYAWVMGPQFETPAEIRMLRAFGAQAVGMSTVPETILARHAGLRVLALVDDDQHGRRHGSRSAQPRPHPGHRRRQQQRGRWPALSAVVQALEI
jgi:purine-nucleoside phosphorylase